MNEEEAEEYAKKWRKEHENGDNEPKGAHITLKVDKSQEMKDLEEENAELKSKLTYAAEKEFDRRVDVALEEAEKLGLDIGFINDPDELKVIERQIETAKGKKTSSREIPLSAKQLGFKNDTDNEGLPLEQRSYSNLKELYDDLDKEAKAGNKDAQNALVELAKKTKEHKVTDFEFQGLITEKEKNPEEKTKWKRLR